MRGFIRPLVYVGIFMGLAVGLHLFLILSPMPLWWQPEPEQIDYSEFTFEGDWLLQRERDLGFEIRLPSRPERTRSQEIISGGVVIKRTFTSSDPDQRQFVVIVSEYPASVDLSDPIASMQATLDSTLTGDLASRRQEIDSGTYAGYPQISFRYTGDQTIAEGFLVLVQQRLYFVLYLDVIEQHDSELSDQFLNSFVLI